MWCNTPGNYDSSLRAAIASIPDPLSTLRPIAEMPQEVPEGYVRVTGYTNPGGDQWLIANSPSHKDTHFIDILLPNEPTEEDKARAELIEKSFRAGWEARDQNYGNLCPPTVEEVLKNWVGGGDLSRVNHSQNVENQQK